ncbi:TetR/AcrR family transcriptional regulator [Butyricimonas sp.]|uniref:TetR/AcrR family transcriptional regulator n=1 Tax=Butyricimonas sp. TaxID=1969738 RepID=UPI0025BAD141|nr:TetR/AcrR family transcriptional regulator [Butyricimonas sp.]
MNDTKNIILLAALRLFLQKGYREITMQDILDASGQAKGTFYYHFKNKETVFEEAARYLIVNYMTINHSRLSYESVRSFIDSLFHVREKAARKMSGLGEKFKVQILIGQASMRIPALGKMISDQEQREREAWGKALAVGRERGEIATNLPDEEIVALFMDVYEGVSSKQLKSLCNIDTLKYIKRDWESLYALITQ